MSIQNHKNHTAWDGSMVWHGEDFVNQDQWMVELGGSELDELQSAISTARKSEKPIAQLSSCDFNMPQLTQRLEMLRDEILHGKGFTVLRCRNKNWTDEEWVLAYWAIGSVFGNPVSQNAKAHLLGHVIDQRSGSAAGTRIYQTNQAQPFHSDSCDIVGLLCLRQAKKGGASSIASSAAIHNAILSQSPELLKTLYEEFQCDRYGEIPAGKKPFYSVSIFNNVEGNLVCCGMDPDIRSAQRLDGVADLSDKQIKALDLFQDCASKLALNMSLQRGDIQLVNNHTVVHARTQYEDYPSKEQRRYMVRLWLSSSQGRPLPAFLAERWGNIEVGSLRGGIRVPGSVPIVHLDPDH